MWFEFDLAQVDRIIDHWGRDPEFVIEMMQNLQETYRRGPRSSAWLR